MKKAEISNQTLGILLVAAIALSLIGTFVTVSKVGQQPTIRLVGYAPATDTGTALVNLTVDQILDVNFTTASVDYGVGSVDPGEINCTLETSAANSASCSGFTDGSDFGLDIENIGNVNITLNLSFDKNAAAFIGGTSPGYEFNWTCTFEEQNACRNTTGSTVCPGSAAVADADQNIDVYGGRLLQGTWAIVNATATNDYTICPNLDYAEANDVLALSFRMIVPADSFTGNLTSTITATAYLIDSQQ